jgi:hypothetical protein
MIPNLVTPAQAGVQIFFKDWIPDQVGNDEKVKTGPVNYI